MPSGAPYVERRIVTKVGKLEPETPVTVSAVGDRNQVGVTHAGNVSDLLWARIDGTAAAIEADDNFLVLPGQTRWIPRLASLGSPTEVSLVSRGPVLYEVELP